MKYIAHLKPDIDSYNLQLITCNNLTLGLTTAVTEGRV